ncbi:vesicle transport through interaction with t-SNAREs homolog 1B isoform X2 [Pyxicephalus adspersus]|uniref:vesicle transport through interaction with t-SNAREs homolog 1B isoform X2 n=1 Tax=Pyxicephalus adspersus TaxID=30357 RepID=UPI003B5BA268
MSSEQFEAIHDTFRIYYERLQKVPECLKSRHEEERKKLFQDFEENQFEAHEALVQMEKELKCAPPSFQSEMMSMLRGYRRNLAKLQTETRDIYKCTGLSYGNSRKEFVNVEDNQKNSSLSQRTLLLDGNKSLNSGKDSIARSHHLAAETDAIGQDIVEVLGGQKEQLERTKDRNCDKQAFDFNHHHPGICNSCWIGLLQVFKKNLTLANEALPVKTKV